MFCIKTLDLCSFCIFIGDIEMFFSYLRALFLCVFLVTAVLSHPAVAFEPAIKEGGWIVVQTASAMDDSKGVSLAKPAEQTAKAWLKMVRPSIHIRCKENKTDLYINFDTSLAIVPDKLDTGDVRIRLDGQKPRKYNWTSATNGQAYFARMPINLLRDMSAAKKMKVEFTPFNGNTQIVSFDLTGIDVHLPDVAAACNWKLKK